MNQPKRRPLPKSDIQGWVSSEAEALRREIEDLKTKLFVMEEKLLDYRDLQNLLYK